MSKRIVSHQSSRTAVSYRGPNQKPVINYHVVAIALFSLLGMSSLLAVLALDEYLQANEAQQKIPQTMMQVASKMFGGYAMSRR